MARAYSGVLGSCALGLAILRGLLLDLQTNYVLTSGLLVFFVYGLIGFGIGLITEDYLREHERHRFNNELTNPSLAVASKARHQNRAGGASWHGIQQ